MKIIGRIQRLWWWWKAQFGALGSLRKTGRLRLAVPLRVDGKGSVDIGENVMLGFRLAPMVGNGHIMLQAREPSARINIGKGCIFSDNVTVIASQKVTIGDNTLIGDQVMIVDSDFHGCDPWRRTEPGITKPVVIGNNVWIGSRCIILRGVSIGDNSVVAAGAVVTESIPANTIVNHNHGLVMNDMSALWDRD